MAKIVISGEPTKEQLLEVERAKNRPIAFDDDCRELSPQLMKSFKCAVAQRDRKNA